MALTKVTRNYQITVPRDIREQAHIVEGDKLLITFDTGGIMLKKMNEDWFRKAFGSWRNVKDPVAYVREMRKGWAVRRKRLGL